VKEAKSIGRLDLLINDQTVPKIMSRRKTTRLRRTRICTLTWLELGKRKMTGRILKTRG
jgi:hypothetical protein